MGQDPTITLSIKEAGERPNSTYLFHIQLDGNPHHQQPEPFSAGFPGGAGDLPQLWLSLRAGLQAGNGRRCPEGPGKAALRPLAGPILGEDHGRGSRGRAAIFGHRLGNSRDPQPPLGAIASARWRLSRHQSALQNPPLSLHCQADGHLRRRAAPQALAPALHGLLSHRI